METKEYTARKIKSAFNKIEKDGKRVTITTICKLLGHPLTDEEKRLVEIEDTFTMDGRRYKKLV